MRPGGTDQQIDTGRQYVALLVVVGAAEGEADLEPGVPAEHFGVVGDLYGEFARRRQRKDPRLTIVMLTRVGRHQSLIGRDQECRSLASAGLRLPGDIAGLQRNWQGPCLNRCAKLEPGLANSREDALVQR